MAKYKSKQTQLLKGDGADPTEAFSVVAQVVAIGEMSLESEKIDATAMSDEWEDFLLGLKTAGEFTVTLLWDPADTNHEAIYEAYEDQSFHNWKIKFPQLAAPMEFQFNGAVRVIGVPEQARANALQAVATIAPKGSMALVASV